jgi:hypothetical protein
MKGNFFLGLLALFFAVLAYTERRAVPPPAPVAIPETSSEPLLALQSEEISAIKVIDRNGCVVVRTAGGGVLSEKAGQLVDALSQARVVRRFVPPSADLSPYGLTQSARRIEVLGAGEKQSQAVFVGSLNPVGDAVYARTKDASDVLLVGSYFLTALDMALQGLRPGGNASVDPACAELLDESETR